MCQFYTKNNITVKCNKEENELYYTGWQLR
jgi:hypothetical protein